ncbi:MAG: hypothetical protein K1X83_10810 [Oligoflexia bacterium]|nr:hypothetical protein [Oligoflexia bacterium]
MNLMTALKSFVPGTLECDRRMAHQYVDLLPADRMVAGRRALTMAEHPGSGLWEVRKSERQAMPVKIARGMDHHPDALTFELILPEHGDPSSASLTVFETDSTVVLEERNTPLSRYVCREILERGLPATGPEDAAGLSAQAFGATLAEAERRSAMGNSEEPA